MKIRSLSRLHIVPAALVSLLLTVASVGLLTGASPANAASGPSTTNGSQVVVITSIATQFEVINAVFGAPGRDLVLTEPDGILPAQIGPVSEVVVVGFGPSSAARIVQFARGLAPSAPILVLSDPKGTNVTEDVQTILSLTLPPAQ